MPRKYTDEQYIEAARRLYSMREKYCPDDGDIEVDDTIGDPEHMVSRGTDRGAYVRAWVWVDEDDIPRKKRKK